MIEIRNLSKIFRDRSGEVTALQDASAVIHDGEIFGIVGMSGAGKSTLLRCLCMLEKPTSGQILMDGQDIAGLRGRAQRAARRQMGVVFQGYNLLMQKTVAENIAFPMRLEKGYTKEQITARVAELLELVGLADRGQSYPSQLSGGQKQRVAIARALATHPKVLLCDEPTSALDPLTTQAMLELLQDINRKLGVTIVIITHELAVVRSICTHVAVIDSSHFVESGRVEEVFSNPTSSITKLLLGWPLRKEA